MHTYTAKDLKKVIKIVKQGGIIVYPTDTAFGIGCRIDNQESVANLHKIKQMSPDKPLPVLVSSLEMAQNYLSPLPDIVRQFMLDYWPGPVTVVYDCNLDRIHPSLRGTGQTLGIRMPKSNFLLNLIENVGVPIIGTSANFHKQETIYTYKGLDKTLITKTDAVIKGRCSTGQVSTVVDCTSLPFKIIRQGGGEINKKYL